MNDFPTAVRIFEGMFLLHSTTMPSISAELSSLTIYVPTGIKAKVENQGQYEQYLEELKPLREELGVPLKEDLYPEEGN